MISIGDIEKVKLAIIKINQHYYYHIYSTYFIRMVKIVFIIFLSLYNYQNRGMELFEDILSYYNAAVDLIKPG